MDHVDAETIEKEIMPNILKLIAKDNRIQEITVRMAQIIGKVVYKLSRNNSNLHRKYQTEIIDFYNRICEDHETEDCRFHAAYNLPCFHACYRQKATEEDDDEAAAPAPAATPAAAPAATQTAASATIPAAESTRPTHVGDIELVERGAAPARGTGTASVSFQLAQETCRQLEMRGDYTLAAEVLARALAQEGLRINHHLLPSATDLVSEPERYAVISKSLAVAMAHMQEDLRSLKAPLLEREPPPLQRLLDVVEREAQRVRCLPGAWLGALRAANELPRPARGSA